MTLEKLIATLRRQGVNSKRQVIKMLKTEDLNELIELRNNINERIRILKS